MDLAWLSKEWKGFVAVTPLTTSISKQRILLYRGIAPCQSVTVYWLDQTPRFAPLLVALAMDGSAKEFDQNALNFFKIEHTVKQLLRTN